MEPRLLRGSRNRRRRGCKQVGAWWIYGIGIEQEPKPSIRLQPVTVPWGPLYGMSQNKLLVLWKTIADHLNKGWIYVSRLVVGAPVLFAKKLGGGLYFYINYRALNAITKYNHYLLPLICETLQSLAKVQRFIKINIYAAFYYICIKKGNKWKTVFYIRFGLFK